ncbi:MAG: hypothetical protein MJ074_06650 [Oscillospiraceae bacterium]|nr:hypothetical protein [Oscillospiraceae bacterium]
MKRKRFVKLCMGRLKLTRNTVSGMRPEAGKCYEDFWKLLKDDLVPKVLDLACVTAEDINSILVDMKNGRIRVSLK